MWPLHMWQGPKPKLRVLVHSDAHATSIAHPLAYAMLPRLTQSVNLWTEMYSTPS